MLLSLVRPLGPQLLKHAVHQGTKYDGLANPNHDALANIICDLGNDFGADTLGRRT
jgi:hypothetical protein